MQTIFDLEKEYCNNYLNQFDDYELLYRNLTNLDLSSTDGYQITKAILYRLKNYYQFQDKTKKFLDKKISAAADDFFVETLLFYLKAYLKAANLPIIAKSEVLINMNGKNLRPDISLWSNTNEFRGFIECKTQLGWDRANWKSNFELRTSDVKASYPDALSFYVVMTESNWGGFRGDSNENTRYFCLLPKIWPINLNFDQEIEILNPIEYLFKNIK
jgi:hypothetical protein